MNPNYEVLATLWPEMGHFSYFARDSRLQGIRLNTAMADAKTLPDLLDQALEAARDKPLYFDVKGRQLRITEVLPNEDHLECRINHPISVRTPTVVLFKAGADPAYLAKTEEDGSLLVFEGGPQFSLLPGESLCIRDPTLKVHGDLFTPQQLEFLDIAKHAGITRYMLSYAQSKKDVEDSRKIIGDKDLTLKIEDQKGLRYARHEYMPTNNLHLLNARGDLFVEVSKPHEIIGASRDLIRADPKTIVGSRLLLSLAEEDPRTKRRNEVPTCADISELTWLLDIGYRRFMFCDGLCLKPEPLNDALNVMHAMIDYQEQDKIKPSYKSKPKNTSRLSQLFRELGIK